MIYLQHTTLLLRRFIAFCYDVLLIFSVLFIIAAIAIAFNNGNAVNPNLFLPICGIAIFIFYGWFWIHGGQTLGMQAWKLKLTDTNDQAINWKHCIVRTAVMLVTFGSGSLWIIFNRDAQSLQDLISGTKIQKK